MKENTLTFANFFINILKIFFIIFKVLFRNWFQIATLALLIFHIKTSSMEHELLAGTIYNTYNTVMLALSNLWDRLFTIL